METCAQGRAVHVLALRHGRRAIFLSPACEEPLGAADYLRIAHEFHTVMIDQHTGDEFRHPRSTAKRFIILIDAFYDNNVKLIASAAAGPDALCSAEAGHSRLAEVQAHRRRG